MSVHPLEHIAPGGGLIICGSQDYTPDIPLENIVTIYDTVYEYDYTRGGNGTVFAA
jgi:hypothetical protein